jgi:hypothetical protein
MLTFHGEPVDLRTISRDQRLSAGGATGIRAIANELERREGSTLAQLLTAIIDKSTKQKGDAGAFFSRGPRPASPPPPARHSGAIARRHPLCPPPPPPPAAATRSARRRRITPTSTPATAPRCRCALAPAPFRRLFSARILAAAKSNEAAKTGAAKKPEERNDKERKALDDRSSAGTCLAPPPPARPAAAPRLAAALTPPRPFPIRLSLFAHRRG